MKSKIIKSILWGLFAFFAVLSLFLIFVVGDHSKMSQANKSSQTKASTSKVTKKADLPKVSSSAWELVLVNRDNVTAEMNPEISYVNGVAVDARIAENVTNFLAAAQAIDASEHLISGYRSVAYQEGLFNSYVSQEMAADPSLTQEQAETKVKTYSQPAGASEHQTGLAIDMSTVDSLNESDTTVASQVQALAPEYGFVLRFPKGKSASTGVDYEDWHYRYVGVESAKYMTKHHLTLEEYVALLKENNQ